MSEKCIITNKCFRDEFDLPLCEETTNDFYTVAEIKHEVEILDEDFEFDGFYDYFPEVMKD